MNETSIARKIQAEEDYVKKFLPYQKAEEGRNAALEEKGRLLLLKGKIDAFLDTPVEKLGERRPEFQDICSGIRQYQIQKKLDAIQEAQEEFAASRD